MAATKNFRQVINDVTNYALSGYESALQTQHDIHSHDTRRWKRFAMLRGGSFLLALVALLPAAKGVGGVWIPWLVLSGLLLLSFLVIAFIHERMNRRIRISRLLIRMHQESIARIKRDWKNITIPGYECPEPIKAVSHDLDLFGPQSLFQLLAIPRTPFGVQTLGRWIAEPATPDEIAARQIAVAELRDQQQSRIDFRLRCEQLAASQSGPSRFVEWAESPNWLDRRKWLLWFCRVTALGSLLAIGLTILGLLPLTISGPTLIVTVALNFVISVFFAGEIHDVFNQISSHQDEISHYRSLFAVVQNFKTESPFLRRIQRELGDGDSRTDLKSVPRSFWRRSFGDGDGDVRGKIDSLGRLNWLANMRRDGMFFIFYLILEFLVMWDVHVLHLLERWKDRHGHRARSWFEALGKWESILALSKLAHDQPEWKFPTVTPMKRSDVQIRCRQLGHPLMNDSRVANDVEVGPPGTVLLVSGSNMSGKSTLLRSVGLNAILAQMGSVVCAAELTMPPLRIETSMRIVDSLASGTSFFMAELKRLKEIVDLANESATSDDHTLLFLLDEILQGTNSRERQIAVSRVVENLIRHGAIGAISTHDLDLATTDELRDACVCVHFTEQFEEIDGRKRMTFDYRMRRGIAETTNALKLLELVGLNNDSNAK